MKISRSLMAHGLRERRSLSCSVLFRGRSRKEKSLIRRVACGWKRGVGLLALQLLEKPGARIGPEEVGRARGDAEDLGRLRDGEAGEIAQLDQLGRLRVCRRQQRERLIHGENVVGPLRGSDI